jgi:hypothetical protein
MMFHIKKVFLLVLFFGDGTPVLWHFTQILYYWATRPAHNSSFENFEVRQLNFCSAIQQLWDCGRITYLLRVSGSLSMKWVCGLKWKYELGTVAHTCNPSCQEAEIKRNMVWSNPKEIVLKTHFRKKKITKKGWWSGSGCRPWVQAPAPQKKKKKERSCLGGAPASHVQGQGSNPNHIATITTYQKTLSRQRKSSPMREDVFCLYQRSSGQHIQSSN